MSARVVPYAKYHAVTPAYFAASAKTTSLQVASQCSASVQKSSTSISSSHFLQISSVEAARYTMDCKKQHGVCIVT